MLVGGTASCPGPDSYSEHEGKLASRYPDNEYKTAKKLMNATAVTEPKIPTLGKMGCSSDVTEIKSKSYIKSHSKSSLGEG